MALKLVKPWHNDSEYTFPVTNANSKAKIRSDVSKVMRATYVDAIRPASSTNLGLVSNLVQRIRYYLTPAVCPALQGGNREALSILNLSKLELAGDFDDSAQEIADEDAQVIFGASTSDGSAGTASSLIKCLINELNQAPRLRTAAS